MKMLTVGLAISTAVLAIMLIHAKKQTAGPAAVSTGVERPDTRGAQDLAAKQMLLGPKQVAEASKSGGLGTLKAQARDIHKKQRAA